MKSYLRKICIFAAMLTLFTLLPLNAFAARESARYELPFQLNVASYILVSLDTGEVIFEKNADEQRSPASLTKLMTSLVAFKYTKDLDNETVTAKSTMFDEFAGLGVSSADIWRGETLSMRHLLYAMLLPSGNEAANMVAEYLGGGSKANFYMIMNTEAKKLGCTNTNFSNPHGLWTDNHYSSAYDMYLIAKACYETPGFMEIATSYIHEMPANTRHAKPYNIISTIKMQSKGNPDYYRSYIKGMKTGSLPEAGHNFVTACEKNGEKYILVIMGAEKTDADGQLLSNLPAFDVTAQIMDYFFDNYSLKNANGGEYPITEVPLKYAKETDKLLVYAKDNIMSVLPNDINESSFQKTYNLPEYVGAPIKEGDVVGTVSFYLAGKEVGKSELVSHENIKRNAILFFMEKTKAAFTSLYFKVAVVLTLILIAVYLFFVYKKFKKHEKMRKIHRKGR